jgi:RHS repeat-associated protein
VVNLKSVSINNTTYVSSTSGGATETITLGLSTGIQQYTYNNVNELTGIAAGGAARFQGSTNKAVKSATINSTVPATLNWSENFTGNAVLSTGVNNATLTAVDAVPNTVTNSYKISVNSGSSSSLTYDSNGNMTSDGTNSYAWDAENRLIKITYPGTNNYSTITYDPFGRCVQIAETSGGTVISTKQFVWSDGLTPDEVRNASSAVTAQYFSLGETISGTSYYYTKDHLSSIRDMTNSSGAIQAQYTYDPFGQLTKLQGSQSSDFQYAGYYYHAPSSLNLTLNRAYSAYLGRWKNRDPIGESASINLNSYVFNNPVMLYDPSGLQCQPNICLKGEICKNVGPNGQPLKFVPPPAFNGPPSQPNIYDPDTLNSSFVPDFQGIPEAVPDPLITDIILTLYPIGRLVRGALIARSTQAARITQLARDTATASPTLKYSPNLIKNDVYHRFPISFDRDIIQKGALNKVSGSYRQYGIRGTVNGKPGMYNIGVDGDVITHREFRAF